MEKSIKTAATLAGVLLFLPTLAVTQRTSVASLYPIYNNQGKPDLVVDPQRLAAQLDIVDRYFDASSCDLTEGVIGAPGYRRLLRFDTVIMNMGDGDLVVGDRSDPNNPYASYFVYNACHGHYHILNFSKYELWRPGGLTPVV